MHCVKTLSDKSAGCIWRMIGREKINTDAMVRAYFRPLNREEQVDEVFFRAQQQYQNISRVTTTCSNIQLVATGSQCRCVLNKSKSLDFLL